MGFSQQKAKQTGKLKFDLVFHIIKIVSRLKSDGRQRTVLEEKAEIESKYKLPVRQLFRRESHSFIYSGLWRPKASPWSFKGSS